MVYRESFKLESRHRAVSFHDITEKVKEIAAKKKIKDGIVVVYSHHTTCSVITQECAFDMSMTGLETLQQDLVNVFENWIPTCRYEGQYLHPGKKALDFARDASYITPFAELGEGGVIAEEDIDPLAKRHLSLGGVAEIGDPNTVTDHA